MKSNHEIIREHYEAARQHDVEGMFAMLAPEARWIETAGGEYAGTYVGKAAILEGVFARIEADFSAFAFELERLLDAGEYVVALGHYRGVSRRSGERLDCRVSHVWHLREGRVDVFEQIVDTHAMRAVHG